MTENELLTVEEMGRADQAAIHAGVTGVALMERAGRAVADTAARISDNRPIIVLCGPGNNGGDGYVAARYLRNRGHRIRLAALGNPEKLTGDAAANYHRWNGKTEELSVDLITPNTVIIDALFGAGLTRAVDGVAADVLGRAKEMGLTSVAVDLPSGINGDTGEAMGAVLPAQETVTFFRKKPGHLLYPGRGMCGHIQVVDIGIPNDVLEQIAPRAFENTSDVLRRELSARLSAGSHKYTRGHLVIAGGEKMTGAARIAAASARRAGAGLVTLAVPPKAFPIYAGADPGNLVEECVDFSAALSDQRRNCVLAGPGLGIGEDTKHIVKAALDEGNRAVVLDADALTSFSECPQYLFDAIHGPTVLTPHEGEFARLFDLSGDKPSRTRKAAEMANAVVVLKGADTVIAAPDGRVAINSNAPPWLATAGSGDALSGIISGLMAMQLSAFDASCAGVWLHGEAGRLIGPGLIAEDIPDALPDAIRALLANTA